MNRSVLDCGGEILAVSQFTLFASYAKGNRPWSRAARSDISQPLFDAFVIRLAKLIDKKVDRRLRREYAGTPANDGPVTLLLDSKPHPDLPEQVFCRLPATVCL